MSTVNHCTDDVCEQTPVALFGPEVTRWTQESLSSLQSTLLQKTHLSFLIETLVRLPSLWPLLEEHYNPAGRERLQQLSDLATGKTTLDPKSLSNVHLAALTLVSHVVDFVCMAEEVDDGFQTMGQAPKLWGFHAVQGFCIGFLSAAAVSCSSDWTEFERNASNALRLAVCIGAIVDAEDELHDPIGRATAVSVRWKRDSDRAIFGASLDRFPDAYVSCITDEKTLTVTLPRRDESTFCSQLTKANISTNVIGINGCFHHSRHAYAAQILKDLCAGNKELQLPGAEKLHLPLRSTADAEIISTGALNDVALDLILCKKAHWFQTVKSTLANLPGVDHVKLVPFGKEPFVPRSLSNSRANLTNGISHHKEAEDALASHHANVGQPHHVEEIAVIGMACRFPQADSLEEYWRLISSGETAFAKLPVERFNPTDIYREPKVTNFWGNFLRHPDEFDHRFFGISGREANTMDPQQRLALQVAYEALESSGCCSLPSEKQATDIGCYLGVGSVDYEGNVASENANAFSATGTLRAFISGRISHFFGWSGPSITFDTACSSSAVAIHSACKALLAKECSMALAGGVNVITSPDLYQNLSAASFLSPKGPSKAFDASANGYCRGEGAGMLVLKSLSRAVADGDSILGVIAGSAVNQSSNRSPITVPDSQSQKALYNQALSNGRIAPKEVTYVEAHGTGTPVGDPIEYESIRLAFAGPSRSEELFLGSVKDNIGHAEGASGAAGIIKALLMMQYRTIPKQANFGTLNPGIKYTVTDKITVPKSNLPWVPERRVALVNNYGAAGSNAAIVLREHVGSSSSRQIYNGAESQPSQTHHPILLSAKSPDSLCSYMVALKSSLPKVGGSFSNIAYNIARRQNPSFEYRTALVAANTSDLVSKLEDYVVRKAYTTACSKNYPVVLCFGGQTGKIVTLSRDIYDGCEILRNHLNGCDAECQALGLPSIFPTIFQEDPVEDLVSLHCMLFSLQFSSAKCWIDCGLQVDTLIGHSLGQLTALCIADSISLKDALRLISGRARLMRDRWGRERGIMLSVECSREDVEAVVGLVNARSNCRIEFACYNGPRSFVLAGDQSSIENLEEAFQSLGPSTAFKTFRLKTTHAYHSYLADGILPELKKVAKSVQIRHPRLRVETCSRNENWLQFTAEAIVQHTRQAVYFSDAIERITARLPSAVWLEAGSASPIITMTRRILASHPESQNIFIPMDLGTDDATNSLAKAACQLWMAGSAAPYWYSHPSLQSNYTCLNLPPYQFEKARHWIQYRSKPVAKSSKLTPTMVVKESTLVSLVKDDVSEVLFAVDTSNVVFDLAARGHAVTGSSICPASMYIELAAKCAVVISDGMARKLPQVENLNMSAPLGLRADVDVFMRVCKTTEGMWDFAVFSHPRTEFGETEHANGRIALIATDDPFLATRMKLLKRLARSSRSDEIIRSPLATGISGPMVYKMFMDVVEYASYYRGVKSLSGLDNEAVGFVTASTNRPLSMDPGVCDPISLDNFLQVAGIHVNCLSKRKSDEVFMCTAIEEIVFSEFYMANRAESRSWTVYTRYETTSKSNLINDIFVYDSESKTLVLIILGAKFRSVPFKSLTRSLTKLNDMTTNNNPIHADSEDLARQRSRAPLSDALQIQQREEPAKSSQLMQKVREMFSDILEIPLKDVESNSKLLDLGIDSLLANEVLGDIRKRFNIDIMPEEFQGLIDVLSLCRRIQPYGFEEGSPGSANGSASLKKMLPNDRPVDDSICGIQDDAGCKEGAQENLATASHGSFDKIEHTYDQYANDTSFANFCTEVLPLQSELVIQYVLEAFATLGCNLRDMKIGDEVPVIHHITKHKKLIPQLYKILQDAGFVTSKNGIRCRTAVSLPEDSASALHATMVKKFPKHSSETKLLHTTAHSLADCLSGANDATALLFRDSNARTLLEDVYTNAPMFKTGTLMLARYLTDVVKRFGDTREIKILELGAGTGGTTKHLIESLVDTKHKFTYTFSDLSLSLVAAAKRKFAKYPFMKYTVLDVEKQPEPQFAGAFDIIISTNCIHATKDLVASTTNIHKMLRYDGILCLIELTRNLFWFDLVFGLLEGWWLFNDGREHVLADETRWERCLRAAGFQWVDWSDSTSEESNILRIITASPFNVLPYVRSSTHDGIETKDGQQMQETLAFKEVDGLSLKADIYYPSDRVTSSQSLPLS